MSRRVISATFIFLVISAAILLVWNNLNLAWSPAACVEPIAYTIGSFDRRFDISQKDFLTALTQAEAIWEEPSGIELFVYAPETGELRVNLIYDYRQETTSALSGLESVVEEDEAVYKTLESKYLGLKTSYNNAKNIYDMRAGAFSDQSILYERQVDNWNAGTRTSQEQFNELEREKVALESKAAELKVLEVGLNKMVRDINILVEALNRLARALNLNVEAYNTIGASRGESFTGGVYYSAGSEEGIDIYEFKSREKLVRILAHELGHALGLEHVDDKEAIMYHLNKGEAEVLTKSDLAALQALCYTKGIKN